MEEVKKMKGVILRVGKKKVYEINGGTEKPGPDSVGSAEIEDEGVKKQDLDKDIQDKLDILDDSNVITEEELEDGWQEALRQAGFDVGGGTQEAGAGEDEVSGDGPSLDDLGDLDD